MKNIVQQSTLDYKKFEMNDVNRLMVKDGHYVPRKDLLASMKRDGFRKVSPITCVITREGKLKIVNGHNRFITAQFLGLPVEYMAYPETDEINPVEWSKQEKQWSMSNYVESYAHMGNENYAIVHEYCRNTGIPQQAAFSMFGGEAASSGNVGHRIKSGGFIIKTHNHPLQVARIVVTLAQYCEFSGAIFLIHAISKALFIPEFDLEKMIERIHKYPELLKKCRTLDEYIELLDLIYNRNAKGSRLYFKMEIDKVMASRRKMMHSAQPSDK